MWSGTLGRSTSYFTGIGMPGQYQIRYLGALAI